MHVDRIRQRRQELLAQLKQAQANANALEGAIQLCDQFIKEEEDTQVSSPSSSSQGDGIPIEHLFPEAVVEGVNS